MLMSFEKLNSSFPRKEFRKDCRRFLEDLVSTILATVATRSPVGQRLSCFCPKIISGSHDYSTFHLFGQMLDELLALGWVRVSEIEPGNAQSHSFVREQRQVEMSFNRFRVPINIVFGFCNQPGFRSRRSLYKVSVMVLQNPFGVFMI